MNIKDEHTSKLWTFIVKGEIMVSRQEINNASKYEIFIKNNLLENAKTYQLIDNERILESYKGDK